MPLKCTYIPNRTVPRRFTAKDAARVICGAIANGASQKDIEDEAVLRLCWEPRLEEEEEECERRAEECEEARARIAQEAIATLQQSIDVQRRAAITLSLVGIALGAGILILRAIPLGAPARIGLITAQRQVSRLVEQLEAQASAELVTIQLIRRLQSASRELTP